MTSPCTIMLQQAKELRRVADRMVTWAKVRASVINPSDDGIGPMGLTFGAVLPW